jgi:hypothetical protein
LHPFPQGLPQFIEQGTASKRSQPNHLAQIGVRFGRQGDHRLVGHYPEMGSSPVQRVSLAHGDQFAQYRQPLAI